MIHVDINIIYNEIKTKHWVNNYYYYLLMIMCVCIVQCTGKKSIGDSKITK